MLAQRCDHRRLARQLNRLRPAIAMSEALARRGDADKVVEIELLAHARQHLKW
jgi:hypothetical protein